MNAITAAEDRALNAHLASVDRLEANHEAACRNVSDKHVAEAVAMVQENLQNQIEAGAVDKALGAELLRLLERIEEVAIECSWADLCRGAQ